MSAIHKHLLDLDRHQWKTEWSYTQPAQSHCCEACPYGRAKDVYVLSHPNLQEPIRIGGDCAAALTGHTNKEEYCRDLRSQFERLTSAIADLTGRISLLRSEELALPDQLTRAEAVERRLVAEVADEARLEQSLAADIEGLERELQDPECESLEYKIAGREEQIQWLKSECCRLETESATERRSLEREYQSLEAEQFQIIGKIAERQRLSEYDNSPTLLSDDCLTKTWQIAGHTFYTQQYKMQPRWNYWAGGQPPDPRDVVFYNQRLQESRPDGSCGSEGEAVAACVLLIRKRDQR